MTGLARLLPFLFIFLAGALTGSIYPYESQSEFSYERVIPVTDREFHDLVLPELESARESIDLVSYAAKYYLDYPSSKTNDLIEALSNAKDRGVRVRIYADDSQSDKATIELLKSEGLNVKLDSSNQTTHAKLLIIDSNRVLVGSTNWTFTGVEKSHEANVLIYSKELADRFTEYFEELWNSN